MSSTTDTEKHEHLNQDDSINQHIDFDEPIQLVNREHLILKPFINLPDYVGCYALGGDVGLKIYFGKKPKWLHRKMMKLCLGWEWIDN
jgi:hypothetical protein